METLKIFILLLGLTVITITAQQKKDPHYSLAPNPKTRTMSLDEREAPLKERSPNYWKSGAQNTINKLKHLWTNRRTAKNIIIIMGDGMSAATITAARNHYRDIGGFGDRLSFERFTHQGTAMTYCANSQTGDSGCTATALLSGVKSNILTLGVNANAKFNSCPDNELHKIDSIMSWAQKYGKATGIVTNTRITDASPAAGYAHTTNRFHECDADVRLWGQDTKDCKDIAQQLVSDAPGNKINVLFGGGSNKFIPKTDININGERLDNRNLIEEWLAADTKRVFIDKREQLNNLADSVTNVLGLFKEGNFDYEDPKQPTLSEMVAKSISILQKNRNGYVLYVEGGLIDLAHHDTQAKQAINEVLSLHEAVEVARNMTSDRDTLIIVTSDHGHTMGINGYARRQDSILDKYQLRVGDDGQPYSLLTYLNGPKEYRDDSGKRLDISQSIKAKDFQYPSGIPIEFASHGGEDVQIYADGPYADYFSRVLEQSEIPHLATYASKRTLV